MTNGKTTSKPNRGGNRALFIVLICLIVAAATVAAVIIINNVIANAPDRAAKGVTISGVDVSSMTKDEVLAATSQIPEDMLANAEVSVSFNGETSKFTAEDLGLATDYDSIVEQAMAYGHTDTDATASLQPSVTGGPGFTVHIVTDTAKIKSVVNPVAQKYIKQPVDATAQFMPWGYLSNGTAYTPDKQEIIEACADSKAISQPSDLVRLSADQMPNKLRYEYWQNSKYIKNYIPDDANVSRFLYTEGEDGQTVDVDALVTQVETQLKSGDIATIEAPVKPVEPKVKLDDLKKSTQLVASWTSSYSNHLSYNRNWNVAKLSGIINGVTIQPGETWSINKEAGNRTLSSGWLEAAGIELGGYTQQAGGGVCQISSTLFNAAIRSNLSVPDSSHHSISSDYIPLGLDATISSGGPDLEIKNPYDTPVYIVSYMNSKAHNVTVEVYGPTVTDATYGDVILDFNYLDGGTFGTPGMNYVYNATAAPDGTQLAPGQAYTYAQPRMGRSVKTFKYFLSPEGEQLDVESFGNYTWNPTNGTTYVNGPAPAATPTPVPAAPASSAPASAAPSTSTGTSGAPSAPNATN